MPLNARRLATIGLFAIGMTWGLTTARPPSTDQAGSAQQLNGLEEGKIALAKMEKDKPAPSTMSVPASSALVRELPLVGSKTAAAPAKALSADAIKLRRLYDELQSFRYNTTFHLIGFTRGSSFAEWQGKVRQLGDQTGDSLQKEIGLAPGELLTLATDYMKDQGLRSEHSDYVDGRFRGQFYPQKKAAGQGRVTEDTEGCADFDKWAQSIRAMEKKDFIGSSALHDEAGCVSISRATVVDAPTRRREYRFLEGGGSQIDILVRTPNGPLWLGEDDVRY